MYTMCVYIYIYILCTVLGRLGAEVAGVVLYKEDNLE